MVGPKDVKREKTVTSKDRDSLGKRIREGGGNRGSWGCKINIRPRKERGENTGRVGRI